MLIFSFIAIAVLTAIDQLIKMLVVTHLKPIGQITVIPGLLELKYVENSGASFGMLPDMSWLFAIMTTIISAVIIFLLIKYKKHNFFTYFAAIAIVAGGIGNLIDRLIFHYVIDYIHVMFFDYIFNFADCCVVAGVISFLIYVIFFMDKKPKPAVEAVEKEIGEDNGNES